MKIRKDIILIGAMDIVPNFINMKSSMNMSLGIVFLGTYLKTFNYSVDVFDSEVFSSRISKRLIKKLKKNITKGERVNCANIVLTLTYDKIKQILSKNKYYVIGVSTCLHLILDLKNISIVREMQPNSIIIVGGPGLSLKSEAFLEESEADIAVVGEGEIICKELLERIKKNKLRHPITKEQFDKYLSDIPFVLCKVNEGKRASIYTSSINNNIYIEKYLPDVDKLPLPDFKLMDAEILKRGSQAIYTNRSCPGACTFCSMAALKKKMTSDGGFEIDKLIRRWMSPERVVEWIIELCNGCKNLRNINFNEDSFTYPMNRAKKICRLIIKNKNAGRIGKNITFVCQTRSNLVDKELLQLMKGAGFIRIAYGAESGSNDMLKCIRKGFLVEDTIKAIDMTAEAGMLPGVNLIFFFPKSKIEDCIKTVELGLYAYENGALPRSNNFIIPYYGTDIEKEYRKSSNIIYDRTVTTLLFGSNHNKIQTQNGKTIFPKRGEMIRDTFLTSEKIILPENSEMIRLCNIFMSKRREILERFFNNKQRLFMNGELTTLNSIGILIYSLEKLAHEKKKLNKHVNKIESLKSRYNDIIEQQKEMSSDFWYFNLDGKIVGLE